MLFLLDGNNILGRLGFNRTAADSQRRLVTAAVALSRERKARVVCVFDGAMGDRVPVSLGAVSVRFAGARSADDVITELASKAREPVRVVTADAGLGSRVKRRNVEILPPREMQSFFEERTDESKPPAGEDWESYFSDPKNRNV